MTIHEWFMITINTVNNNLTPSQCLLWPFQKKRSIARSGLLWLLWESSSTFPLPLTGPPSEAVRSAALFNLNPLKLFNEVWALTHGAMCLKPNTNQ